MGAGTDTSEDYMGPEPEIRILMQVVRAVFDQNANDQYEQGCIERTDSLKGKG